MTLRLPVVLTFVLVAVPAWTQFTAKEFQAARRDPKAFTLDESSLRIEALGPTVSPAKLLPPRKKDGPQPMLVLDSILNVGERLWKIIADNAPVVDILTQYATALPEGSTGWDSLERWQPPAGVVYSLTAKNLCGHTVINVRYQVLRTFGGSYKGKGRYLTAVTVQPLLVEVDWGFKFTMEAAVPDVSVINAGTAEDPIAAMTAQVVWRVETPLKDSQGKGLYYLQGDGLFKEVGGPLSSAALIRAQANVDRLRRGPPPLP